jgi:hypothetical protein
MRKAHGTFPPPDVLKATRAHARGRPGTRRALTLAEALALPLSRLIEVGTADDIAAVVRTRFWFGLRDAGRIRHRGGPEAAIEGLLTYVLVSRCSEEGSRELPRAPNARPNPPAPA